MAIKSLPIRQAIKQVLHTAFVAKETGNRELYLESRDWLYRHLPLRHTGKSVFTQS